MTRFVAKYSKISPYGQVDEYEVFCQPHEMRHLFDVDDDEDMIFVYPIKSEEQINFFKEMGVPIDPENGYFYIECYAD